MKWPKEFIYFIVIGISTNSLGFLLYVLLTTLGLSPVLTISIFYPIFIGLGFYLNKKLSFSHKGRISTSAFRYLTAYAGCYVVNVAILKFFNGYLGYSHLFVQAFAVLFLALLLFMVQKHWVFRLRNKSIPHVQVS